MGLFGKRTRLRPGDTSTWQMGQDGLLQGDTAVRQEAVPGYWQGGEGFSGRDGLAGVLAVIGDAFAQRGGGQPMAMRNLMGTRNDAVQMAREAQAAQQARMQGLQDYEEKQKIDQRYAPAKINDTEADYNFMVQTVGKEAADGWLRNRGDPMVNTTLPNGQFYSGPQSGLPMALGGGQPQAAPPKPVGRLTPLGGAASPASPPFLPLQGGIPRRRR